MGSKKTNTFEFNWVASPNIPYSPNVPLSGVTNGVMSGTNTIYSNVQFIENVDNVGVEIEYTGTAAGTITILASISGNNFFELPFNPIITQPAGSTGGCCGSINQQPYKYLIVKYVNASGAGILNVYLETKDLN